MLKPMFLIVKIKQHVERVARKLDAPVPNLIEPDNIDEFYNFVGLEGRERHQPSRSRRHSKAWS
jgi:hypothetical protein